MLAYLWITLVGVFVLIWVLYCVTPDHQRGVFLAMKLMRRGTIQDYQKANQLIQEEKFDQALPILEKLNAQTVGRSHRNALGRFRTAVLLDLGTVYQLRGSRQRAKLCLDEAVKVDPGNFAAHLKRGQLLMEMGEDQAEEALQQALQINPNSPETVLSLCSYYHEAERFSDAVAVFEAYQDTWHSVIALVRVGSRVQQFGIPADGNIHQVIFPLTGLDLMSGRQFQITVSDPAFRIERIAVKGMRRMGETNPVVLYENIKIEPPVLRRIELDVFTLEEQLFSAPEYIQRVDIPGISRPAGSLVLHVSADKPLSDELFKILDEAYAGLDNEEGRQRLRQLRRKNGA